jgi:hypothetical protein
MENGIAMQRMFPSVKRSQITQSLSIWIVVLVVLLLVQMVAVRSYITRTATRLFQQHTQYLPLGYIEHQIPQFL